MEANCTSLDLPPGPPSHASPPTDVVKFSFKQGGERSFLSKLHEALGQRQWETTVRFRPVSCYKIFWIAFCSKFQSWLSHSKSGADLRPPTSRRLFGPASEASKSPFNSERKRQTKRFQRHLKTSTSLWRWPSRWSRWQRAFLGRSG